MIRRVLATSAASLLALASLPASAEEPDAHGFVRDVNLGLRVGFAPIVLIPTGGSTWGGGLDVAARYGVDAGPVVLAPGGRASGYYISDRFIGQAMPTLRVTLPVGAAAPYGVVGVGPGWVTNPSEGGLALLAGGGVVLYAAPNVVIGGELTYQEITGTDFRSLAFGPVIAFIGG